jgi:glycosyltransferase involved in cell wall biosynthesis
MQLLSILVPAFNEGRTLRAILTRIVEASTPGFDKQIVVCDDGSDDDTVAVARAFAARDNRVIVVSHSKNRGKGAAIRTALAMASGDYVLVQDADLEYETGDYAPILARAAAGARAVYGSRFLGRRWPTGMTFCHFVANRILTVLTNVLFGTRISDEATCLKLVHTNLMRSLALTAEGFDFCPELTARLALGGVRIDEVPARYAARTREQGKKIRASDFVRAVYVLVAHRMLGRRRVLGDLAYR